MNQSSRIAVFISVAALVALGLFTTYVINDPPTNIVRVSAIVVKPGVSVAPINSTNGPFKVLGEKVPAISMVLLQDGTISGANPDDYTPGDIGTCVEGENAVALVRIGRLTNKLIKVVQVICSPSDSVQTIF